MRLRGAKEDLESLGEDTDGMADSFSDLRDKVLALSGVDILKNNETFKSTYDILKELSSVWNDLTDINQAALTEYIAGKLLPEITAMWLKNHFNCR